MAGDSTKSTRKESGKLQAYTKVSEGQRWSALVAYFLMGENLAQSVRLTGHSATTIRAWERDMSDDERDLLRKMAVAHKGDITSEMVTGIRKMMIGGIMGLQLRLLDKISTQINGMSATQATQALRVLNDIYIDERDTATGMKNAVSNARTSISDEILKLAGIEEATRTQQQKDYRADLNSYFTGENNGEEEEEEEEED